MKMDSKRYKNRIMVMLLVMVALLAACGGEPEEEEVAALPSPTDAAEQPAQPQQPETAPTTLPAALPAPNVAVMTNTPPPATDTPEPTATPEATDTPEPTAVPPTSIPPTAVPPTAVPPTEPPPPPPPPIGINGLVASSFNVEKSEAGKNDQVWFNFNVANSTGGDVSYYSLGVMPKKDGVDRKDWYQQSWKGADSVIDAGGKEWRDNIKLPESGDYTLRLVICFDSYETCTTRSGTYHSLSPEVPIKIR